jgi:hypothetical protein
MKVDSPFLSALLLALVGLTVIGCAITSFPVGPTATAIAIPGAYPPPPIPPANPDLVLTPTSILEVVVSDVTPGDDGGLMVSIYPSEHYFYTLVEIPADAYVEGIMVADIAPDMRLGLVAYEKMAGDPATPLVAREVKLMEVNASLLTPTPAPRWGEPGYPAPVVGLEPAVAEQEYPNFPPLASCNPCDTVHVVGVVTEEIRTGAPAGEKLVRLESPVDGGVWHVAITSESEVTFEDWSPGTSEDIAIDGLIDVVGVIWSPGYIGAQYVIVLDPEMNSFPQGYP